MTFIALNFEVIHTCDTTKVRVDHFSTEGTLKGLSPEQLHQLNCRIIFENTYRLGHRSDTKLLKGTDGLDSFMY
ncbi:unnamed protein product [Adineta steineri]|uniref:tRNA-guanine(15) transglycosylase-like domain-containing protein n=1 Tax=Adineta steineri TaxID=433720 RepID=A0A814J7T5_9BILA|nr:unnamed protein product [Adineta steineri]CAF1208771.1 unnamed protein product [Adineta steineri]